MSQDAEKTKKLIDFKVRLTKRIEDLETELKDLQATLEIVNSILLEKGFRRADSIREPCATQTGSPEKEYTVEPEETVPEPVASENITQLKSASGELLAVLYMTENSLRALPSADKNFDIGTPPFNQFLVERVLMKMQERDNELVKAGQLPPDNALSYSIVKEGDLIREICIRNADAERMRELKSSIRWTLEKMYEKTKNQS
ncbi:MAG TPA: hypothetical protein VEH86_00200 [Candidatus Acidoferrum sp.]|nr:hypothetical protein [Candidatus Acidoferrum sp.]